MKTPKPLAPLWFSTFNPYTRCLGWVECDRVRKKSITWNENWRRIEKNYDHLLFFLVILNLGMISKYINRCKCKRYYIYVWEQENWLRFKTMWEAISFSLNHLSMILLFCPFYSFLEMLKERRLRSKCTSIERLETVASFFIINETVFICLKTITVKRL